MLLFNDQNPFGNHSGTARWSFDTRFAVTAAAASSARGIAYGVFAEVSVHARAPGNGTPPKRS